MYLAYRTPEGWSSTAIIAYAFITNLLLMTLYSANNMPYAALGGVMTGDSYERTSLNAYRFVAVNLAQLIVTGFHAAAGGEVCRALWRRSDGAGHRLGNHDGHVGRGVRGVLPDHLRHDAGAARAGERPAVELEAGFWRPAAERAVDRDGADDADPLRDHLAARRGVLQLLPLLCRPGGDVRLARGPGADRAAAGRRASRRRAACLEFLGWVAHGDRANLAGTNVADVAQSVIGVIEKVVFIVMILLSPMLTARFGKKAVAVVGFALMTIVSALWYLPAPDQMWRDGRADGARRHRLRADDSRAVVDVRRRGRLLGMDRMAAASRASCSPRSASRSRRA